MHVAIIGLGLIGGSLQKALGPAVTGFDADPATRKLARADGLTVADSVTAAAAGADLIVLAVPLPAMPAVLAELDGHPALITDVGSVKQPVRDLAAGRRFVGGHPMAGKESSGFAAAEAGLFAGCAWVLCLEPDTDLDDWLRLAALVTGLGARVVPVPAAEHDAAVAKISHVPHLFAAALTAQLLTDPLAGALAAGSFRDGTRVAATRPELIMAMCAGNAGPVSDTLGDLIEQLTAMRTDLLTGSPRLPALLARTTAARRDWPPAPGAPATLPADRASLLELGRSGGWVTAVDGISGVLTTIRPETDRNPA